MKAAIMLELFKSQQIRAPKRPYVAEITGHGPGGFKRRFLRGDLDWLKSNSAGSRGQRLIYIVEAGRLYEVCKPETWRSVKRYWVVYDEHAKPQEMTIQEALKWISEN